MADYIKPTSTSSLHSSPSRKRTRDPSRSGYLASCKSAATVTSNVEVMEPDAAFQAPAISPRSAIHTVHNGLSSTKSKASTPNGTNGVTRRTPSPPPVTVSSKLRYHSKQWILFINYTLDSWIIHFHSMIFEIMNWFAK